MLGQYFKSQWCWTTNILTNMLHNYIVSRDKKTVSFLLKWSFVNSPRCKFEQSKLLYNALINICCDVAGFCWAHLQWTHNGSLVYVRTLVRMSRIFCPGHNFPVDWRILKYLSAFVYLDEMACCVQDSG